MTSRPNGFTLFELVIALAVFGLLLVGLTQGFHFGLLASRTAARLGAENGDLDEIDLALRHLIEAMTPVASDADRPALLAAGNTMTFLTDLPGHELPGAGLLASGQREKNPRGREGSGTARPIEATLFVDSRHRLMLRWRPISDTGQARAGAETETEIMRGVARMELAFWRRGGGWIGAWQSADLPAMVRVRLVFVNSRARPWPDIVSAPLLDRP